MPGRKLCLGLKEHWQRRGLDLFQSNPLFPSTSSLSLSSLCARVLHGESLAPVIDTWRMHKAALGCHVAHMLPASSPNEHDVWDTSSQERQKPALSQCLFTSTIFVGDRLLDLFGSILYSSHHRDKIGSLVVLKTFFFQTIKMFCRFKNRTFRRKRNQCQWIKMAQFLVFQASNTVVLINMKCSTD